jgi:hypothetical protein
MPKTGDLDRGISRDKGGCQWRQGASARGPLLLKEPGRLVYGLVFLSEESFDGREALPN